VLVLSFDADGQTFAALVLWVVVFADVDVEEARGAGVFLEEAADAPFGGAALEEGVGESITRENAPHRFLERNLLNENRNPYSVFRRLPGMRRPRMSIAIARYLLHPQRRP